MIYIVLATLLAAISATEAAGPTQSDKFVLARLYELSRQYRAKTQGGFTIEYYGSMTVARLRNMQFTNLDQVNQLYTIHDGQSVDVTCHQTRDYEANQNFYFNNYVLLPRYPTNAEVRTLTARTNACQNQLPRQFNKFIVAYIGRPPANAKPEIKLHTATIIPAPFCANDPNVGSPTVNRLRSFFAKFQKSFETFARGENYQQYAVVYYGDDVGTVEPPYRLFNGRDNPVAEGDDWIAAFPDRNHHSEIYVLDRLECQAIRRRDVYLFTYNSPCTDCAQAIQNFARQCSHYKSFTVFYRQPYRDCLESTVLFQKNQDVKINFFQLPQYFAEEEMSEDYDQGEKDEYDI